MIKFSVVKVAPEKLKKGEHTIVVPNFLPEVLANKTKAPKHGLTGVNQLRYITDSIAMKYDPTGMTGWSVKPHMFEGRPYKTDEELSEIIVEMLKLCCPKVFGKYVQYELANNIPPATEMIYLVDPGVPGAAVPLLENSAFTQVVSSVKLPKQEDNQ